MRTYSAGIVTAYGAAKVGGYIGTYEEFCAALGALANVLEELENFDVDITTLPAGEEATASYADGVLSLGIPKGDKGDTGATGAPGNGILSIEKTSTSGLVDTYTILYTDGASTTFTVTNGEKGDKGDTGATGAPGNGIVSIEKTATSGLVDTYTITFTDGSTTTFDVTNGEDGSVTPEQMAAAIATALENYATTDGTYEDMAVGELISSNTNEDTEPYIFRKTGGSTKAGKREYLDKIVGVSLVENQLIDKSSFGESTTINGVTFTNNGDGSITVNGTATANSVYELVITRNGQWMLNGHAYLITFIEGIVGSGGSFELMLTNALGAFGNIYRNKIQKFNDIDYSMEHRARIVIRNGYTANNLMFKPQIVDLTAKYGATIADYINSLETATAGAGIAWLGQYMDLGTYIPFAENTFKHVTGLQSHDTVGLNQWDEVTEHGYLGVASNLIQYVADNNRIRSKNWIPVLPNTTYHYHGGGYGAFVVGCTDENGHGAVQLATSDNADFDFTTRTQTRFVKFACRAGYGGTYKNDVCINLSSSRNGTYEPYIKHSYPLDSSVILRGIPTLVDGKMANDGDEYQYDGKINRDYNLLDLGTLNWQYYSAGAYFYANIPDRFLNSQGGGGVCDKYSFWSTALSADIQNNMPDKMFAFTSNSAQRYIYIKDSDYANASEFKAAVTGSLLVYKTSTTIVEQADPYQQVQVCDPYGTEEFVGAEIPVGTVTEYPEDLTAKIEGLPWDLSMIAPIENGTTASQAYTAGQYFLRNNVFCKALTSIASGATFTLNTNYTETTLAAELYTALH